MNGCSIVDSVRVSLSSPNIVHDYSGAFNCVEILFRNNIDEQRRHLLMTRLWRKVYLHLKSKRRFNGNWNRTAYTRWQSSHSILFFFMRIHRYSSQRRCFQCSHSVGGLLILPFVFRWYHRTFRLPSPSVPCQWWASMMTWHRWRATFKQWFVIVCLSHRTQSIDAIFIQTIRLLPSNERRATAIIGRSPAQLKQFHTSITLIRPQTVFNSRPIESQLFEHTTRSFFTITKSTASLSSFHV